MDSKQKFCAVFELMKQECRLSDIHGRLQNVYGDDTIDCSNVQRWMKTFKEGESRIGEKPCSGRPSAVTTNTNLQRVELNDGTFFLLGIHYAMKKNKSYYDGKVTLPTCEI